MQSLSTTDGAFSPYPPIADYAFLSDCEVSALVAPSGNVEWMCLPRMDGPSIFGALLDRDAGFFKVAPMGQRVPIGRRYLPGTMILETTWATRTGWVVVLDLLLIGPWHHDDDRSTSHRRSPTDSDADHVLLRMMSCINGQVEMHVECEPQPGLRPRSRQLGVHGLGLRHRGRARRGGRPGAAPDDRPATRLRARAGPRAHDAARGRHRVRRADVDRARGAEELRRRLPADELHGRLLARLALARRVPRPPVADLPAAQRADAEGPDLRADGRDVRGADDLAAGDAGRRAQLGLPLQLDPRLGLHALGPSLARLRPGGRRLLLLHRGRRLRRPRPPGALRDRRRARDRGARAPAPRGLRDLAAGARRERGLQPEPARRLGHAAGLRLHPHPEPRSAPRELVAHT